MSQNKKGKKTWMYGFIMGEEERERNGTFTTPG